MNYLASISLLKLGEMINAKKNAAIRQKLLVVLHKKIEKTERR